MIRTIIRDTVSKFSENSLAQRYLDSIENSETLAAFEAGGESKWRFYLNRLPDHTGERDEFKTTFFKQLLKPDLYNRITKLNGYEAAFVVHNAYLAWGRSVICDFTTERYDS